MEIGDNEYRYRFALLQWLKPINRDLQPELYERVRIALRDDAPEFELLDLLRETKGLKPESKLPPGEIISNLGGKPAAILCEVWNKKTIPLKELERIVWKGKAINPETVTKTIKRLNDGLEGTPYYASVKNQNLILEGRTPDK